MIPAFGPSSALLNGLVPLFAYLALLWALLFLLYKLADRLCVRYSRLGVPSNADNAWAVAAFEHSRLALLTCTICIATVLSAASLALRFI